MPPKALAKKAAAPAPPARARSKSAARGSAASPPKAPSTAAPKAKAKAPPASPEAAGHPPQAAEPPSAFACYHGEPLSLAVAETLLKGVTADAMMSLAESNESDEQLPARMLLEFVGDKDLSWANAQASLRQGHQFIKEVLEMEGANFVTRRGLERLEALGPPSPGALLGDGRAPAAFVLAAYVEAVVDAAKDKLGLKVAPAIPAPGPDEKPPAWPIVVDFKELNAALSEALKWKKTPIFICSGKASVVDTFFAYQGCTLIDAKWILNKVDIAKEMDVQEMREELRRRLVAALKYGKPIHISMANSAVSLRAKYCCDDALPEALFKQDSWFKRESYSQLFHESDLADWPGAFPGRMRDDSASYVFVTSDFTLETAQEYLAEALPHFQDMAFIEIDAASIT